MVTFLNAQLFFAKQYRIGCHVGVHLGPDGITGRPSDLFSTCTSILPFAKSILLG